ncbi:MAG TPA: histidinol dehydrogenase, partial [Solirubrobacteraceae bacterium]|nr:histidinol dehydrogenase [Solirubrobacteraceae bacterium]
ALDDDVRAGLEAAIANVRAVADAGLGEDVAVTLPQGHTVRLREVPVRRAAIYVPGGRAPYPSTVVMGVVTARAAGVDEVVVCAPGAHPVILAAAALCGADRVYRMGGAHAVAALAYGTERVPRVDVIAGPGSLYVQEAKRLVSGDVGIDGFAGPSDLLVLASTGAAPRLLSADLAAQAEHGDGTLVCALSDDAALLDALRFAPGDAAVAWVQAPDLEWALGFAEAFAPEHLQLAGAGAEALAPRIRSAGCVFVGEQSGTAFGDYVAGSNHTLPTDGAARFSSGLNVRHFRRRMSEVRVGGAAAELARAGVPVARAEGFERHAVSMEVRENPAP